MEQQTLFTEPRSTEPRYVIDTSSLVDIRLAQDPPLVWNGILRLIESGRLLTVSYVFPELERMATDQLPPEYLAELKRRKRQMVIPDAKLLHEAGRINHKHPRLGDWRDPRNRADPWLVAAGKVYDYTVVTEERDTGPKKSRRIPWVCDEEKVKWTRIDPLIRLERLDQPEAVPDAA